jgi:hypothetical protein
MPSKLSYLSTEGEAEEEAEVTKEEGAVQVTLTQVEDTDNRTRIKISKVTDNRIRMRVSKLNEAEGQDELSCLTFFPMWRDLYMLSSFSTRLLHLHMFSR